MGLRSKKNGSAPWPAGLFMSMRSLTKVYMSLVGIPYLTMTLAMALYSISEPLAKTLVLECRMGVVLPRDDFRAGGLEAGGECVKVFRIVRAGMRGATGVARHHAKGLHAGRAINQVA